MATIINHLAIEDPPEVRNMNAAFLPKFVRQLPLIRSRNHTTTPYHIGSVLENQLGLQVFRIIGKHIARSLRGRHLSKDISHSISTLEHDGILVIEDFLQSKQFEKILEEFEKANYGIALEPYKNVANAKLYRRQLSTSPSPELFPTIESMFRKNALLDQISSAVLRKNIVQKPDVLLDTYQNLNNGGIDNDIENILHADLHVPTVKMFFYLNKVDETNGAFIYVKGSHKLTFARIVHEYEMSVRQAKFKVNIPVPEHLRERRAEESRNIISPENRRRMNIFETQICVKPNTLVVTNNMGFHRRGEFTTNEPRKALLINYRNAEQPFR